MAQSIDLYVRLQAAQAREEARRLEQQIQQTQQAAMRQLVLQADSRGATKEVATYNDELGRTIKLIEQTRQVRNRTTGAYETVVSQTRQVSENYEQIARNARRATQEAERLAEATRRAQTAFNNSLSGDARTNYTKDGGYGRTMISAQEAIAQTQRTTAYSAKEWQDYYNTLNGINQKCQETASTVSIFGEMSEAAFRAYSEGAQRADEVMQSMQRTQALSAQGWQEYYNNILNIGQSCGVTANEVSVFGQLSDEAFQQYSTGAMSATEANTHLHDSTNETSRATKELTDEQERLGQQTVSTTSKIGFLNTAFLRLAHSAISAVIKAFKDALQEMKDVDSQLIVVRKVTDFTSEQLESIREQAYSVGKQYGVTASQYLESVAELSRAGYKEQSADLAELAVKLQIVGDVSQETANKFLIATDKAYQFNGDAQALATTIDQLNEIDNNFATSIQKMAEGMGLVAPVAAQAHVSITELEAAIGTMTATTQRSGSETARALRALFINILGDTTTEIEDGVTWTVDEIQNLQDVLKVYSKDAVEAAQATGELINPMEAIAGLAKSYKDGLLTEKELTSMVLGLGGKLRSSYLLALIQNWDMYEEMLQKASESTGSAEKEIERALDSWERKINILQNTWTDFIQKTIDTRTIKDGITLLTKMVEWVGNLENALQLVLPIIIKLIGTAVVEKVGKWVISIQKLVRSANDAAISFNNTSIAVNALMIVLSGLMIAYRAYNNSIDQQISKSKEQYQQASENTDALASLYGQYVSAEKGSQDFKTASQELSKILADEKDSVDSLSGSYDKLIEKYRQEQAIRVAEEKEAAQTQLFNAKSASQNFLSNMFSKIIGQTALDFVTSSEDIGDAAEALLSKYLKDEYSGRYEFPRLANGGEAGLQVYKDLKQVLELIEKFAAETNNSYLLSNPLGTYQKITTAVNQFAAVYDPIIDAEWSLKQAELKEEAIKTLLDGEKKTREDIESFLSNYEKGSDEYNFLVEYVDKLFPSFEVMEENTTVIKKQELAFAGLKNEIESATKALEKYTEALEGGEKGDTLKKYAEIYKNAKEMFEQGLYGSTQYQAALDLLLPDSVKEELGYDYKKLGEKVFGEFASGAWEALYGSEGGDYGAILATYLRDNAKGMEDVYEVINDNGESFDLLIHDEDKLAEKLGMTTEQVYAFMDALDIHHSDIMLSTKDVKQLIEKYGDLSKGIITDSAGMIRQLVKDGRTESEIRNIINQLERAGQIDVGTLPEDIGDAVKKFEELEKQENELPKEATIEIKTDPEKGYFNEVLAEIDTLNKKKIVIGVSYKVSDTTADGETYQSNWQGVDSARAGTSLINELGPELIVRGKTAFTVNDGNPTLFKLQTGDKIFNAQETAEILGGSNVNPTAAAGGIPVTYNDDKNNNSSGNKNGKKKSTPSVADNDLLSMLSDYIADLLNKAKKALDAQIDAIDAQIEALQKEHDAEEEANELEELRLKILEAEKNLVDANVERTVRYFNKATGQWEWMADQKAVAEAQKALEDAQKNYYDKLAEIEYQAKLDELKAQKEALQNSYNNLSDSWEEIKDEISKALNQKDVLTLAEILTRLGLTAASGSVGGVNSLISNINAFTGSFDNGGFAFGSGYLRKGVSQGETVLDESITRRILSPMSNAQFTNFTNSLTKLFGMSSGDIGAKAQSLVNSINRSSSITGDTYYINGVRIGSDMMDRPLSDILSVLPIYAG